MRMLWCWRCRREVPLLDEQEFAEIASLNLSSIKLTKELRAQSGVSLKDPSIDVLFQPVRDRYEQLTSMKESNHNAIMHHRLSLYGPPCVSCGKPLRSPQSKLCGSCMAPVKG